MDKTEAEKILNKIVQQVFGVKNSLSIDEFVKKFAFDLPLPQKVKDSTDGSDTWATSINPTKFITAKNARNNEATSSNGLYATQSIKDLTDLLSKWDQVNFTTTEFSVDSLNISESDLIMNSENVFHSGGITRSKNILYSNLVFDSEFVFGSDNSGQITFCIRTDDSIRCANSFGVTRSADLTNCIMMHDCGDMQDSMFCSNMKGRQYCIANMQFEKSRYFELRSEVVAWLLTPNS